MIVKTVEMRAGEIGDQVRWIDGVHTAQIIEHAVDLTADECFAKTYCVGSIATAEERAHAEDKTIGVPLPRTRWMVVWLYRDDGMVDQLLLGNGAQAFLLNGQGHTIDRLI